ncbi:hypothetical protein RJ639_033065 [Escallonia herrerae]|uniref:Amine oxidase domain-containing protein n=1 Tax=Escallonia herrerae TaxID=1293975 RepID=A0AA88WT18_9ASTE|nr:hypothetical protein RJ639_033065 [Escallonia herrerae]
MAAATGEDKKSPVKRVAVVGAGVSGLAAAYKLKLHGLNVTIFEAEGRAGGKLRTVSQNGLIWDEGANTMTETEVEVSSLLDKLGFRAFEESNNFQLPRTSAILQEMGNLYGFGQFFVSLVVIFFYPCTTVQYKILCFNISLGIASESQIPSDPIALIRSNFLSAQSKVVDYLIDPFVAGSSAGDPESLSVTYMPLSVIVTTFKKENVKRPLEGFGVLIPSKERQNGLKTLGTLFSSMMFPDRAPSDLHLYTTFVGGSQNKELVKVSSLLYWSKAFSLYGHNYDSVLEAIEKLEKDLPGFYYAGSKCVPQNLVSRRELLRYAEFLVYQENRIHA